MEIIGVDHGFGYVKTKTAIFAAGVARFENEPPFMQKTLKYNGAYYTVGGQPDGLASGKTSNEEYYVLTLAAIAEELKNRKMPVANVHLAAGLPLTTFGKEKSEFEQYLLQDKRQVISFEYEMKKYQIRIEKVSLYPQGYAAIAPMLSSINGSCYIVDIGTGTTDILFIGSDKIPDMKRARTIPQHGISTCISAVNEQISREFGVEFASQEIIDMIRGKDVVTNKKAKEVCNSAISDFAAVTLDILRQNKVNYMLTPTYIIGGGATLLEKHVGNLKIDDTCIKYLQDIRLNAIGYEMLAECSSKKEDVSA